MDFVKKNIRTLAVLIILLCIAGFITYKIAHKDNLSEEGSGAATTLNASESTPYTDLQGTPFSFDQFEGKVRVVNSWATWSSFSQKELRDLEKLAIEFKDEDVVVLAINRMETKDRAEKYLKSLGSFSNVHFVIDLTDAFYKAIGGFSVPETIFYDKNGNIVAHMRGSVSFEEMKRKTIGAIEEAN